VIDQDDGAAAAASTPEEVDAFELIEPSDDTPPGLDCIEPNHDASNILSISMSMDKVSMSMNDADNNVKLAFLSVDSLGFSMRQLCEPTTTGPS